jgi:flavodoxin
MNALIVYDSPYGNTEKIAQAIGKSIGGQVLQVREVNQASLKGFDLLIIGSPTHGGFPTEGMYGLLKVPLALEGINVAAFDTRTKTTIFGYAAPKIARSLQKNGGNLLAPPEGFTVLGMHGPLQEGELERATDWAKGIARRILRSTAGRECPPSTVAAERDHRPTWEGEARCLTQHTRPS